MANQSRPSSTRTCTHDVGSKGTITPLQPTYLHSTSNSGHTRESYELQSFLPESAVLCTTQLPIPQSSHITNSTDTSGPSTPIASSPLAPPSSVPSPRLVPSFVRKPLFLRRPTASHPPTSKSTSISPITPSSPTPYFKEVGQGRRVRANCDGLVQTCRSVKERGPWFGKLKSWWCNNVSLEVAITSQRDHLALERTFLAYIRTSLAVCVFSVAVAQLMRLQGTGSPHIRLGYYELSIPLASTGIITSIVIALCGASRFLKQQNAIARGQVYAGGLELLGVGITVGLFLVVIFGLFLSVTIRRAILVGT